MNEGPHHSHWVIMRRIAKQSIGSNTPHTFSQKNSHTTSIKTFFFTKNTILIENKQNSLLQHGGRYFMIFYNSSHRNTCSVYRIPPQNTPRKTEHVAHNKEKEHRTKNKGLSLCFYFYNFHNPTHTPSQKLISITNINNIKFNFIKFIKIFIKIFYKILSHTFHKNSTKNL